MDWVYGTFWTLRTCWTFWALRTCWTFWALRTCWTFWALLVQATWSNILWFVPEVGPVGQFQESLRKSTRANVNNPTILLRMEAHALHILRRSHTLFNVAPPVQFPFLTWLTMARPGNDILASIHLQTCPIMWVDDGFPTHVPPLAWISWITRQTTRVAMNARVFHTQTHLCIKKQQERLSSGEFQLILHTTPHKTAYNHNEEAYTTALTLLWGLVRRHG